jgi:RNA polymerase sigma-70 factor (ECF subfamily)
MTDRAGLRRDPETCASQLESELAAVFAQHGDFLWRVLKRFGTPPAELEDALQEVLLIVARKLPAYQERGSMRAWLFAIARQVAQHAVRASQRRLRRETGHERDAAPLDPHAALERSEASRFVEGFLQSLGEPQATVFFLAEVEGMTAPEIAACMDVGLNTIYSRLRLARERFEHALDNRKDRCEP